MVVFGFPLPPITDRIGTYGGSRRNQSDPVVGAACLSQSEAPRLHRLAFVVDRFWCDAAFRLDRGTAVPNLIAILHTILAINDLITAVLLFGQYAVARPRGLNILAGGYLFTALMSVSYLLSFPGAVSGPALIYGDRSAPWLYVVWHAGLSLAIIVYASLPVRLYGWRNGLSLYSSAVGRS